MQFNPVIQNTGRYFLQCCHFCFFSSYWKIFPAIFSFLNFLLVNSVNLLTFHFSMHTHIHTHTCALYIDRTKQIILSSVLSRGNDLWYRIKQKKFSDACDSLQALRKEKYASSWVTQRMKTRLEIEYRYHPFLLTSSDNSNLFIHPYGQTTVWLFPEQIFVKEFWTYFRLFSRNRLNIIYQVLDFESQIIEFDYI